MKKFLTVSIKFLMPLIISLLAIECSLHLLENRHYWYMWLADYFQAHSADCLFVGTSMTSAAINVDDFDSELLKKSGRKVLAINMGEGYTTIPEYYFGLRKVLESNAQALKGCTVFIEAPAQLPRFSTWKDDWMNPHSPRLLSLYLTPIDFWHYLTTTNASFAEKVVLPLSKISLLVTFAPVVQETVFDQIEAVIDQVFPKKNKVEEKVELTNAGGIRSDAATVAWVRQYVHDEADKDMKGQKPINWDETVVKDLVQLIQSHGGTVVFYQMPISSVMERPYKTEIRLADKTRFADVAAKWHCLLLKPDFVSKTDEDFPDLLHLRPARVAEMSRALADAYAQAIGTSSPGNK